MSRKLGCRRIPRTFSFEVFSDGSVLLKLEEYCLQAAARRAHGEVTAALLEGREAVSVWAPVVGMLEQFLAATDFSDLRSKHPELAGGSALMVRLWRRSYGEICWELLEPQ